jgi:hypothetical protein
MVVGHRRRLRHHGGGGLAYVSGADQAQLGHGSISSQPVPPPTTLRPPAVGNAHPVLGPMVGVFIRIHFLDENLGNAVVELSAFFVIGLPDAKVISPFG